MTGVANKDSLRFPFCDYVPCFLRAGRAYAERKTPELVQVFFARCVAARGSAWELRMGIGRLVAYSGMASSQRLTAALWRRPCTH